MIEGELGGIISVVTVDAATSELEISAYLVVAQHGDILVPFLTDTLRIPIRR